MLLAKRRLRAALDIEGRVLRTAVPPTFEAEVHHVVIGMIPAERGRLATREVEVWLARAGTLRAIIAGGDDPLHADARVISAERWLPAAFHIEGRLHQARIMCATLLDDVHHAFPGVLHAECRLEAFEIPAGGLRAGIV